MNKIIFQVGLLSFCISAVVYASLDMPLIDVIARAFIVYITTILISIGIVFATSMLSVKEKEIENTTTTSKSV